MELVDDSTPDVAERGEDTSTGPRGILDLPLATRDATDNSVPVPMFSLPITSVIIAIFDTADTISGPGHGDSRLHNNGQVVAQFAQRNTSLETVAPIFVAIYPHE